MGDWLTIFLLMLATFVALVLVWILIRAWAERRFFARIASNNPLPVLIYDHRGRLRYLSPGILIFDKKPPVSILTQSSIAARMSHPEKLVEVDSIVYRCELNSLTGKNRRSYCVATLEFVRREI